MGMFVGDKLYATLRSTVIIMPNISSGTILNI